MAELVEFSIKRGRRATGLLALRLDASAMPSKLVMPRVPGVPEKACTSTMPEAAKKEGKPVRLNVLGVNGVVGVAVKRDHRSVTVSELEEAMVVPCAAVNAVT